MFLIGSLLSLPYILLFYVTWIFASLLRPFIVISLGCVLSNPAAALRKGQLLASTITYLIFCNDKTWKQPKADPASFFANATTTTPSPEAAVIDKKTVIFVRHGESAWNETFNKGDRSVLNFALYFIPNLLKAVATEWYFWCAGQANESWFFDSPLSEKGRQQAESIRTFLSKTDVSYVTPKEAQMIRVLRGENDDKLHSSQLVCSNLRRAIATVGIGFQDRLVKHNNTNSNPQKKQNEKDPILILPALQEISRNPDALTITPAHGRVVPAWTDPKVLTDLYQTSVDTSRHTGNKAVTSNGLLRMQEFCQVAFQDIPQDYIIVGGHSLWFRSFFRTFLPYTSDHVSKKKKLINGGIVGFTLQRIKLEDGSYQHMIDPTSILVLHGGF